MAAGGSLHNINQTDPHRLQINAVKVMATQAQRRWGWRAWEPTATPPPAWDAVLRRVTHTPDPGVRTGGLSNHRASALLTLELGRVENTLVSRSRAPRVQAELVPAAHRKSRGVL